MKRTISILASIVVLFVLSLNASAQNEKCPISGQWWYERLGGNWGEAGCYIFADKKVGQNTYMEKRASNGYIDISDVYFEKGRNYNLVYVKTTAPDTYEFSTQYFIGKQLKNGKLQIKVVGSKIAITALDPVTKKQPIHGKTFNPVQQQ